MNKVRIRIAGKDYRIVGTEPEEYIQKVGLYVDKKMTGILEQGDSKLSTVMAAVLSCINIADDYFKERDRANQQKSRMTELEAKVRDLEQIVRTLEGKQESLIGKYDEIKIQLAKKETELNQLRGL
ncbi:MAG: cell division protein ZapA [Clostridia bacterium]